VTYKTGFGLDDWIYCTLCIHTTWDYRQYSATAILHTFQFTVAHSLGFSVLTSCILVVDLSQSHCHFKSHMKSSFPSLIPFLPLFCNCQLSSIPLLPSSYPSRLASRNSTRLLLYAAKHFFITTLHRPCRKTAASVVKEACLLIHCLAVDVLLLHALAPAGMYLQSCCLAMGIHVTIL
jgi:hypothetical protein